MRVANVYDINNKVYVLKLSGNDNKLFLLIEGIFILLIVFYFN